MSVLTRDITDNLAYVFFCYPEDYRNTAMSVLKILDFDYKDGELIYEGCSPSVNYRIEDLINYKGKLITPYLLKTFDVECLETAINTLTRTDALALSALFDAIGWIIRYEIDKFKIHFVGGVHYDSYVSWNEEDKDASNELKKDIIGIQNEWKTGDDWPDRIDMSESIDWRKYGLERDIVDC